MVGVEELFLQNSSSGCFWVLLEDYFVSLATAVKKCQSKLPIYFPDKLMNSLKTIFQWKAILLSITNILYYYYSILYFIFYRLISIFILYTYILYTYIYIYIYILYTYFNIILFYTIILLFTSVHIREKLFYGMALNVSFWIIL